MNYWSLIAIVLFLALLVSWKFTKRGELSRREHLPMLPGEKVIFIDNSARFRAYFRGTAAIYEAFPRGRVEITDHRLIFSQKMLFSRQYVVVFTINYREQGPVLTADFFMGKGLFQSGRFLGQSHLDLYTTPERVVFLTQRGRETVEITVPFPEHGPFLGEPRLVIATQHSAEYQKIFGRAAGLTGVA